MELLAPYVGKRIKLIGKAVDMEVVGRQHREIWAARLEVLPDAEEKPEPPLPDVDVGLEPKEAAIAVAQAGKSLKIIAKGPWQYVSANPNSPKEGQRFLIRSAAELTTRPPWNQLDAPAQVVEKQATAALAKALKVDTIDWKTQMLVVVTGGVKPTGGWRIDVQSVEAGDKEVVVNWSLTPPQGFATQAFTHPAQLALVERAEGTPKFVQAPGKIKPKVRPKLPVDPSESPARRAAEIEEAPAQDKKGAEKELKLIARANGRLGTRPSGHLVIRNPQELTKLAAGLGGNIDKVMAQATKALKVDKIDWDKQMLIVLSGGTQRTGGYSIEVMSLKVKDDTLTVNWKLNAPRPGQPVTQALTNPALTLLVERFDSTVEFNPPRAKSSLDKAID